MFYTQTRWSHFQLAVCTDKTTPTTSENYLLPVCGEQTAVDLTTHACSVRIIILGPELFTNVNRLLFTNLVDTADQMCYAGLDLLLNDEFYIEDMEMQLSRYHHQSTPLPSIGNVCPALWCRNMDPLGRQHDYTGGFPHEVPFYSPTTITTCIFCSAHWSVRLTNRRRSTPADNAGKHWQMKQTDDRVLVLVLAEFHCVHVKGRLLHNVKLL